MVVRRGALAWLGLYLGSIVAANLLQATVGIVALGGGQAASSGAFAAGITFTARDFVQDTMGRTSAVVAIVAGACLSALISPTLAVASGTAFLLSELLDFAIYTPLRTAHWIAAVVLSNTAGALLDSYVFVTLAFGSTDLVVGQTLAKLVMTGLAVPFLLWSRRMAYAD